MIFLGGWEFQAEGVTGAKPLGWQGLGMWRCENKATVAGANGERGEVGTDEATEVSRGDFGGWAGRWVSLGWQQEAPGMFCKRDGGIIWLTSLKAPSGSWCITDCQWGRMEARTPGRRLEQAFRREEAVPGPGWGAVDRFRICSGGWANRTLFRDWTQAVRLQRAIEDNSQAWGPTC